MESVAVGSIPPACCGVNHEKGNQKGAECATA